MVRYWVEVNATYRIDHKGSGVVYGVYGYDYITCINHALDAMYFRAENHIIPRSHSQHVAAVSMSKDQPGLYVVGTPEVI